MIGKIDRCNGIVVAFSLLFASGCSRHTGLPEVGSKQYRDLCSAFYVGLAGLQAGEDVRAREGLRRSTEIAPGEPAGWANLGILQVRQQEFDAAFTSVDKARSLSPENSQLEALLGLIESRRGKIPEALQHFEKAVSLEPGNLKALYSLAVEADRQGDERKAEGAYKRILAAESANLAVLLDLGRLEAKQGETTEFKQTIDRLRPLTSDWPDPAKRQFGNLEEQAAGSNPRGSMVSIQFLRNFLQRFPGYRKSLDEVRTPPTVVAEPFIRFIRLPSPASEPAAPDTGLRFQASQNAAAAASGVTWVGAAVLNSEEAADLLWADGTALHFPNGVAVPLPGNASQVQHLSRNGVAAADLNYDFKTDFVIAGRSGLKIYLQTNQDRFKDVTTETKLPPDIRNGSYTGAWAFDVDLDGDLDIVLGVQKGAPVVLRNNGDGTFALVRPFAVDGLVRFSAADIDGDGDPDVVLIDGSGAVHVFTNERLGSYRERPVPAPVASNALDVAAADLNGDGAVDFAILRQDLSIVRLSNRQDGGGWDTATLAKLDSPRFGNDKPGLLLADLDNNGALDLIAGDQVLLSDGRSFRSLGTRLEGNASAVLDVNRDGRLDIIGLTLGQAAEPGRAFGAENHGVKNYHWQNVRTRATNATGDQRINSFGIGGEIEVRADLLTQKQVIASPLLHYGLGEHSEVDFARIVWPNGLVQAEFTLKPDQTILAQQRLKGSCPFLFTWDGHGIRFVKDTAPWSPALGLHINAQQVAGIYQTREWFKIPGEQLVPHDDYYDLRVTAEYWETYYIDHYSLMVVDHPSGTEIYADERFAVPPPALRIYATNEPQPFASARDDNSQDVTATVRSLDSNYLDTFGRGQYQGVTRDHWVELELPPNAPSDRPLYLIADGWMHPTDATTNVALGQNSAPPPHGLSIEVPDRDGHWTTARQGLGFPAGRVKTVVLDLTGIFRSGGARKLRLRTNLEVYWDKLAWASPVTDTQVRTRTLPLSSAELGHRGFSKMTQANRSSPELPDYNILAGTGQVWRDLIGYCTRYGDVRELLSAVDDRIVITNAGDELRLRFPAQPVPPTGWKRDYIMVGDGWIKDGDYNSTYSETVLPLPYHAMKDYEKPPGKLEDDPAYRLHPGDWQAYQTRFITTDYFRTELWRR